ncbi:MAG TPA: preprotein translocase subunit SecG [Pyrinomonadaceae bacterium]
MVTYVLYGLFILTCIVLVVAVLLQPGKADAGALFSSSVSSTAFGPRGTQTILAKLTIGAAALFMLIALVLSLPIFGTRSVLQSAPDESQPAASPAPQQQPSPAATTAPSGAASPAGQGSGTAPASTTTPAPASTTPATSPQAPASSPAK